MSVPVVRDQRRHGSGPMTRARRGPPRSVNGTPPAIARRATPAEAGADGEPPATSHDTRRRPPRAPSAAVMKSDVVAIRSRPTLQRPPHGVVGEPATPAPIRPSRYRAPRSAPPFPPVSPATTTATAAAGAATWAGT